ncbi:DNA-directed RNA polymerase III subunit RPC7 isoform X3 [Aphelocoma coerulescens]|uniref:DNA-directed RNA polymerase III subunit RPC7 isoform X3 n=1 Tax=Aphelocoma coerulescens TaxID=39617 RepID=UPI003604B393
MEGQCIQMAESGRGGGCASFTFSIEAICSGKDAALPDVICKPPLPFQVQPVSWSTLCVQQLRDTVKRTRTMKKSRKHGHQSYFLYKLEKTPKRDETKEGKQKSFLLQNCEPDPSKAVGGAKTKKAKI